MLRPNKHYQVRITLFALVVARVIYVKIKSDIAKVHFSYITRVVPRKKIIIRPCNLIKLRLQGLFV